MARSYDGRSEHLDNSSNTQLGQSLFWLCLSWLLRMDVPPCGAGHAREYSSTQSFAGTARSYGRSEHLDNSSNTQLGQNLFWAMSELAVADGRSPCGAGHAREYSSTQSFAGTARSYGRSEHLDNSNNTQLGQSCLYAAESPGLPACSHDREQRPARIAAAPADLGWQWANKLL
ncbi:hypothetical protein [Pseudomonas lopnurensis]|uniref:hypothetical protein n=2 Tax=Pseudomonas lopnurensis TaxID=1477517 RepID=UPI0028AEA729|nr:hypothetical protein [Pseudomonas lopnurensis]